LATAAAFIVAVAAGYNVWPRILTGNLCCSAPPAPKPAEGRLSPIVPFYAIYGEYDYWPMKLGALVAGEWRGSQNSQNPWTTNTQSYWLNRLLGLTLEQGVLQTSHNLADGISGRLIAERTPISLIINPTATVNRYKSYIWSNKEGIPLFVWSQCYGRGHNQAVSDVWQLWENWFSKWQRDKEDRTLLYWKDGVGVGAPVKVKQTR
jgi:hypothetical protein